MSVLCREDLKRKWIADLQIIADEMEGEGYEVEAEHLDFIMLNVQNGDRSADRVFSDYDFIGLKH